MSGLTDHDLSQLKKTFPQLKFKANFLLSKLTYFKIGGPAEALVKASTRQDLIELINYCSTQNLKFTILGGASNVIVPDEGVEGLVILTRHQKIEVLDESPQKTKLRVDSGITTTDLVRESVDLGLTGLEPFSGIPGSLGGAIYNNSHFQTELIGTFVDQVEVLTQQGDILWIKQVDCDFAYDQSRFQTSNEIILRIDFTLLKSDSELDKQKIKESTLYRARTQPLAMPSSGCIFKNIPNTDQLRQQFPQFADRTYLSAGFLIDQTGLKGTQVGDMQVSSKHAAFMINLGRGTADDLSQLIELVKQKVKEKFKVELEEEVFWLH
jgi:UDP-N-acetylenolpyruvoylglucosamine reductase